MCCSQNGSLNYVIARSVVLCRKLEADTIENQIKMINVVDKIMLLSYSIRRWSSNIEQQQILLMRGINFCYSNTVSKLVDLKTKLEKLYWKLNGIHGNLPCRITV